MLSPDNFFHHHHMVWGHAMGQRSPPWPPEHPEKGHPILLVPHSGPILVERLPCIQTDVMCMWSRPQHPSWFYISVDFLSVWKAGMFLRILRAVEDCVDRWSLAGVLSQTQDSTEILNLIKQFSCDSVGDSEWILYWWKTNVLFHCFLEALKMIVRIWWKSKRSDKSPSLTCRPTKIFLVLKTSKYGTAATV